MPKLSTSSKYFGINKLAEMQEETGRLNRVMHWGFKVLLEGGMVRRIALLNRGLLLKTKITVFGDNYAKRF